MTHKDINEEIINQLDLEGLTWFYDNYKNDKLDFEFEHKQLVVQVYISGSFINKIVYTDEGDLFELEGTHDLQPLFDDWFDYYTDYINDCNDLIR